LIATILFFKALKTKEIYNYPNESKDKAKNLPLIISSGIVSGEKQINGEPAFLNKALGKG